jgi:hypothetical protein
MQKSKQEKARKPKSKLEIDRKKFEIFVRSHATEVKELIHLAKKGDIKSTEWVFTLDQLITICDRVAMGIYYNARKIENPKSKWASEAIRKQVTQFITNAFS